ncbi:MAG: PAS domain S-box protein [Desulfobacteraceae bacterium]|nr:MAG: PAS domain S-box protein [Desulfobacteraceae bacterium]
MSNSESVSMYEERIKALENEVLHLKLRESVLKESGVRLQHLFNGAGDAIFILDKDANFVDVNDGAMHLTGYSKQELIGRSIHFIHDEKGVNDFQIFFDRIMNGEAVTFETRIDRKDKSNVDIECSSRRIVVQEIPYSHMVARDITERKQAQALLLESEERYRTLFEQNPIETIIVDREGRVSRYNLAKKRSGNRLPGIGDIMYKEYARKHEIDMYGAMMGCIRTGKSKDFPVLKYEDRFLRINISPFPGGAIITSIDITDHKRVEEALRLSEERFRTAFETSPDAIQIIRSGDGVYIDVNEGFTELTGFSRDEVINRSSFRLSIWDDASELENFTRLLQEQRYVRNMQVRFRLKNGKVRIGLISARMMVWNNEPHILSVTRDIDDLKKAEADVRKMEEDRKQKERLQIILETAGAVCHELNQPLMAISGYSELILMGLEKSDPLYAKNLKILEQVTRMGEITGKLMGITKYKTKRFGKGGKIIDIDEASQ